MVAGWLAGEAMTMVRWGSMAAPGVVARRGWLLWGCALLIREDCRRQLVVGGDDLAQRPLRQRECYDAAPEPPPETPAWRWRLPTKDPDRLDGRVTKCVLLGLPPA